MYIERSLQSKLLGIFDGSCKKGIILAGVVGCGKTTLVGEVLRRLKGTYQTFSFSGDDALFRNAVSEDTTYIHKHVRSQTQGNVLVFVDEVQKSGEIFDAVKYAFDHSDASFIVSGSNPDYLNTTAKKRLQRRADLLILEPFSLAEILAYAGIIELEDLALFREILQSKGTKLLDRGVDLGIAPGEEIQKKITKFVREYIVYGGLPLAHLARRADDKLIEIRKVIERGFESMSTDNETVADTIRIELAKLHSREFAYQGIFQRTGLRRRDVINKAIDELINYGYLIKKKPYLNEEDRRSYLSVYSYVDPGMVTYLTGATDLEDIVGQRIEGIVHARLDSIVKNQIPLKSKLFYYKPYTIDKNDKIKFRDSEIDFIVQYGSNLCALEVKATNSMTHINASILESFVREKGLPFGIVLYGGMPYWNKKEGNILYWPYWLI